MFSYTKNNIVPVLDKDSFIYKMFHLLLKPVIAVFSISYVLRQTIQGSQYSNLLSVLLLLSVFIVMLHALIINTSTVLEILIENNFLAFFISYIFTIAIFQNTLSILIQSLKIFFMICFLSISFDEIKPKRNIIIFADFTFLTLGLIITLSYLNLISSYSSQNEFWVKNYSGFLNPNIPGFFIFSIACCYFVYQEKTKFFLSFCIWLLMLKFQTYSRTFSIGMCMLVAFQLTPFFFIKNVIKKLLFYFSLFTLFLNFLFVLISLFHSKLSFYLSNSALNTILSNRLARITYETFQYGSNWYELKIFPFDGIHYELLFTMGIFSIVLFIFNAFKLEECFDNPSDITYFQIGVYITIIVGLLEGIFAKVGPTSLILYAVLLMTPMKVHKIFSR